MALKVLTYLSQTWCHAKCQYLLTSTNSAVAPNNSEGHKIAVTVLRIKVRKQERMTTGQTPTSRGPS